jgi:hypothetical protein
VAAMAQTLRRRKASTAEDSVHQPVLTKTLGNLDRQEAPLKALARLIHPLVPSIRVIKDTAETAAHNLSHIIFGREPAWPRAGRSTRRQVGTA